MSEQRWADIDVQLDTEVVQGITKTMCLYIDALKEAERVGLSLQHLGLAEAIILRRVELNRLQPIVDEIKARRGR